MAYQETKSKNGSSLTRQRADAFDFLSYVFMELPDSAFAERMVEAGMLDAPFADDMDSLLLELGRDRARLLRSAGSEKMRLPYESQFGKVPLTDLYGQLQEAYAQQGVRLQSGTGQPLDYLGVEMAFLQLAAAKEAELREAGDEAAAEEQLVQQRRFYDEHLFWVNEYGSYLEEKADTGFYQKVGQLLADFQPFEDDVAEEVVHVGE